MHTSQNPTRKASFLDKADFALQARAEFDKAITARSTNGWTQETQAKVETTRAAWNTARVIARDARLRHEAGIARILAG